MNMKKHINKKLECKLYLDFLKTRMSLWDFSEEATIKDIATTAY